MDWIFGLGLVLASQRLVPSHLSLVALLVIAGVLCSTGKHTSKYR